MDCPCPIQKLLLSKQLSFVICPSVQNKASWSEGERPQHLAFALHPQFQWLCLCSSYAGCFAVWNQARHHKSEGFLYFHSTQRDHMDTIQRNHGFSKKGTFIFGKDRRTAEDKHLVTNSPRRQVCPLYCSDSWWQWCHQLYRVAQRNNQSFKNTVQI